MIIHAALRLCKPLSCIDNIINMIVSQQLADKLVSLVKAPSKLPAFLFVLSCYKAKYDMMVSLSQERNQ